MVAHLIPEAPVELVGDAVASRRLPTREALERRGQLAQCEAPVPQVALARCCCSGVNCWSMAAKRLSCAAKVTGRAENSPDGESPL